MTKFKYIPIKEIHTIVFDFDGVFTNNKLICDENGVESVECSRADGYGINLLKKYKDKCKLNWDLFILSTEVNNVVQMRAKKLNLKTFNCIENKTKFIEEYFEKKEPKIDEPYAGMIYLGNDLNDLEIMSKVKYSIAPSDAHPKILEIAYNTYAQKGGEGFVRAFIEDFLQINKLKEGELNELISYS